jgi:hypothetical protein
MINNCLIRHWAIIDMEKLNFEISCISCDGPLTDPVCVDCYSKQLREWLRDLNMNSMFVEYMLAKIGNLNANIAGSTECIICKEKKVTLCRNCFSLALLRILNELNFPRDLINVKEFNLSYGYAY